MHAKQFPDVALQDVHVPVAAFDKWYPITQEEQKVELPLQVAHLEVHFGQVNVELSK